MTPSTVEPDDTAMSGAGRGSVAGLWTAIHSGTGCGGNNVIVKHVAEHRTWRIQLDHLLAGHDAFWLGVDCDLAEIDRRKIARDDRSPARDALTSSRIASMTVA